MKTEENKPRQAILKTRDGLVQLYRCDRCGYLLVWNEFDREESTFFGNTENGIQPEHTAVCLDCTHRSEFRATPLRRDEERKPEGRYVIVESRLLHSPILHNQADSLEARVQYKLSIGGTLVGGPFVVSPDDHPKFCQAMMLPAETDS